MYRTSDPIEDYEPAASVVNSALAPEALISVGALSVMMAGIVVACHLYGLIARHRHGTVFDADDKLLLTYFYAVIVIFVAVAASR